MSIINSTSEKENSINNEINKKNFRSQMINNKKKIKYIFEF